MAWYYDNVQDIGPTEEKVEALKQLPGLQLTNKEMKKKKKMCVIPKSAVVFHFAADELYN